MIKIWISYIIYFPRCESNQQSKRWQGLQNAQNKHPFRATETHENKTKQYQCGETGRK